MMPMMGAMMMMAKQEKEPDDAYMTMDVDTLKKEITSKKEKLMDERTKRNYIQMEKEMIFDFYGNTRVDLEDCRNMIGIFDHDIEHMEDDHKVEMTVYMRKLQYLEYEHREKDCTTVETRAKNAMHDEDKDFKNREEEQKKLKKQLVGEYKKNESTSIEDIKTLEDKQEGSYQMEIKNLETQKNILIQKYEDKLENLRKDLELRIKVEIHELEERKNQHINNLRQTHSKQYEKVKESYNNMTKQQLALIKQTTSDKDEVDKRIEEIQELIRILEDTIKENEHPKEQAEVDLKKVEKELGTYTRSKMPLGSARIRLEGLKEKYQKMLKTKEEMDNKYLRLENQKTDMYNRFEKAMERLRKRADYKNTILENKLSHFQDEYEKKDAQLQEVIQRARFDPKFVEEITKRMEEAIEAKNSILRNLKYALAHAQKAYNDAIRVYEAKLVEFGIPAEELGLELLETNTSTMPAGLVAAQQNFLHIMP